MSTWTPERVELLKQLWANGKSATAIELALDGSGITRNAVIGKVHRLKLPTPNLGLWADARGTLWTQSVSVERRENGTVAGAPAVHEVAERTAASSRDVLVGSPVARHESDAGDPTQADSQFYITLAPAHFLDGSPDIAPFWYATIFTDGLAGMAIVAFTAWSALAGPGRYRSRRANPTRAATPSRTR